MTSYYAYLRDKVAAAAVTGPDQLQQLVEAERNAFWQMLVTNPAYDERSRMGALAAFDEAASQVMSESERRFGGARAVPQPGRGPSPGATRRVAEYDRGNEPRARSWGRDAVFLLIGLLLGLVVAYFGRGLIDASLKGVGMGSISRGPHLVASVSSFKFGRSSPSEQEGEITVENGSGAGSPVKCEVEATYRQLLEYVRFDSDCTTISYKFVPLSELIQNFNYLQGYIVFTATISSAGRAWKGTASVYFSVDASA